jgi:3-oxoacyl-[acyl-carrier protein] reductase
MSEPIPAADAVVVSGGTRGLGLAIVSDLLESGATVATFARSLTPEITALAEQWPGSLHARAVDATDRAAVDAFLREAEAALGPLTGLVNNAAIGQDSLHVHTSPDRIAEIIAVNQVAPLLLTRSFIRRAMAKGLRTRIVFVTSICARRGYSGLVAYSSTKGGLEAAARTLARELHGRALVNSVAPGFFASEMSASLGNQELATITRRTPSGHLVEPDNITPVVRMLMREDTNINGQTITVDGGGGI